jgi:cytochrome c5
MKKTLLAITTVLLITVLSCTKDTTTSCSTTNMKYSGEIKSIIDANCVGCHGTTQPAGQLSLVTYDNVKNVGAAKLAGVVNHSSGFKAMPPTSKMSQCNIDKIQAWIAAGFPN